jgi:putative ABC transport system permease protein
VTYALEAVAVLVGLFGLSSSLGAIVFARRREFGVLRHLGMTRREIGTMLAAEGRAAGARRGGAGLVLGAAISLVLVYVVNPAVLRLEHGPGCAVRVSRRARAGAGAARDADGLASGREAMGMAAVRAVKEDW